MNITINSKKIKFNKITVRGIGFGQPIDDNNIISFKYRIYMEFSELSDLFEVKYDKFITEMEEDDRQFGEACQDIKSTKFAKFSKLFSVDKNAALKIIKNYLYLELLESCFENNDPNKCRYAINSLRELKIEHDRILISGEVYQRL